MPCHDCAEHHENAGSLTEAMHALTDAVGQRDDERIARFAELLARPAPVHVAASNKILVGSITLQNGTIDPVLLVPAARDRIRLTISVVSDDPAQTYTGAVQIHHDGTPPINRYAGGASVGQNHTGFVLRGGLYIQTSLAPMLILKTAAAVWVSNPAVGGLPARIDWIAEFLEPLQ